MEKVSRERRLVGRWRLASCVLAVLCAVLTAYLISTHLTSTHSQQLPVCGATKTNVIDLSEPSQPGPFHDLTRHEIVQLRQFLENHAQIHAAPPPAKMSQSQIFTMDLFLPKKSEVLRHLDQGGPQPPRRARVVMFRGDLSPPVVQEYICGPLPHVTQCDLLKSESRRNPVEFSLRPISITELEALYSTLMVEVDKKVGYILRETYGKSYVNCEGTDCFGFYPTPVGTNLIGDINKRQVWIWANMPLEYYVLHPVDFGYLADLSSSQPDEFYVDKVWFHGQMYDSLEALVIAYNNTEPSSRYRFTPRQSHSYSTLTREGPPPSEPPQRPPTLVEPDGKRYSLKNRKVDYKGWSFNFRSSSLTGPSLYDIRFNKQRIVYELGLSEIAVLYSASNPTHMAVDFVDSGALIGIHSKSLVPGADCPDTATFMNQSFMGETVSDPVQLDRAWCMFENNNGHPLRRHLSYSQGEGAFYSGMLDSVLVLRSILTIVNYDYVLDYIFHQNGVIETRVMSTGYIFPSVYTSKENPYGFRIEERLAGNLHHHLFHFKADIDIQGTSNRYETLDIVPDTTRLEMNDLEYHQTKFNRNLKSTEKQSIFDYDFTKPKYHIFHNNAVKSKHNAMKGFRLELSGMSKQLYPADHGNEATVSWARHQLVVTRHRDDEVVSSSPYAMYDSKRPVTDFSSFYNDDENIEDEDLVAWATLGMHHIPHTEDLPVTPTPGNHLTFFLLPYNYFDKCPSMTSTDQIRVEHISENPKDGVRVDRNRQSSAQCALPKYGEQYENLLRDYPDVILESQENLGIL